MMTGLFGIAFGCSGMAGPVKIYAQIGLQAPAE